MLPTRDRNSKAVHAGGSTYASTFMASSSVASVGAAALLFCLLSCKKVVIFNLSSGSKAFLLSAPYYFSL